MSTSRMEADPGRRVSAFTVVEMLVVIGVMAILLGLLLPAIGRARSGSYKTRELHNIREIYRAWTLYGNTYDDAALPGYLSTQTQTEWNVGYEFSDRTDIAQVPAGPYPWRLMRFLDFNHEVMHGRLDSQLPNLSDQAVELAQHPAFAYNAFYVGGWWEPHGTGPTRPRYGLMHNPQSPQTLLPPVVAKSMSQVGANPRVVLFCSAAVMAPGTYHQWSESTPGSHFVLPPIVAGHAIWTSGGAMSGGGSGGSGPTGTGASTDHAQAPGGSGGSAPVGNDPSAVHVFASGYSPQPGVPICRYTNAAAVLWADGSTNSESPGTLADQRRWIYRANTATYTHPDEP